LAVVVGAAVHTLFIAVKYTGIGANPVQWRQQWAIEVVKIANGVMHPKDYALIQPKERHSSETTTTPQY
jgi:hypothetical protein